MSDVTPPPGMAEYVAAPAPQAPMAASQPPPGMEDYVADQTNERVYGGAGQQALAAIEGLGRGATLGASDVAAQYLRSGAEKLGIDPDLAAPASQDMRRRAIANPVTETAANMAGSAALISGTGGIASPIEAKLGGGLLATAAGYGTEGAALAAGNLISEKALGDSDLNAQKIAANLGMGAMLGVGFGLAGRGIASMIGKSGAVKGTVSDAVAENESQAANEEGIAKAIKAQSALKENAPDIIDAAKELGAPVTEGMVSASPWVQRFEDSLVNGAPTYSAIKKAKLYEQGYEAVESNIKNIVGEPEENGGISKAQFGQAMEQSLSHNIETENAPIAALFESVKPITKNIPLSKNSLPRIAQNIMELDPVRLDPQGPAASLANRMSKSIENIETVDDVKSLRKVLSDSISPTASPGEKYVVSEIQDRLKDLEERTIESHAKNLVEAHNERLSKLSPEEAASEHEIWGPHIQSIEQALADRQEAMAQYAPFINKIKKLAQYFGKKRISGPQGAIDFITEEMTPEKLVQKVTQKGNSEFENFFYKNFPNEGELLKSYQKSVLRDSAIDARTGEFNSRKFIKQVFKTPQETLDNLFTKSELKKLEAAKTYLRAIPENFNPSGTSHTQALRSFFEHPVGAAISNARDFGMDNMIKIVMGLPPELRPNPIELGAKTAEKFNKFTATQQIIDKTNDQIASGAKSIFNKDSARAAAITGAVKALNFKQKEQRLYELNNNFEALAQHMTNHTVLLQNTMPETSQAIQRSMVASLQFLNEKLPKPKQQMMLSPEWEPSEMQKQKFDQYYDAVNNPIGVLDQVKQGKVTSEAVEAIGATHPGLLNEMRMHVMGEMDLKKAKDLPFSVKQSLALFLGEPLETSQLMSVKMANQASWNPPQMAQAQNNMPRKRSNQSGLNKLKVANRAQTDVQDLEINKEKI